jgi:hypothetical protein
LSRVDNVGTTAEILTGPPQKSVNQNTENSVHTETSIERMRKMHAILLLLNFFVKAGGSLLIDWRS